MSQLVAIFEKIMDLFFLLSPLVLLMMIFCFLIQTRHLKMHSKYIDELYEFSQIANTIPREDNFWAISDHHN